MLVAMAYINPRSTNGWRSGGRERGRQAGRQASLVVAYLRRMADYKRGALYVWERKDTE